MSLKFCANLSFMFQEEASLLKRYSLASSCGFKAVECAWPYDFNVEEVIKVKTDNNLKQILINTPVSKEEPGKLGLASIPNMETEFLKGLETSIKYARALDCSLIHIMSGTTPTPNETNYSTYVSNLTTTAKMLENENITALIEPINKYSVPNYYMNSYDRALKVIQEINSEKLKLMLDVFHLQQIRGNLSRNIKELLPYVGHIQIAQVPDRHEPDSAGEINYEYLLQLLEKEGYTGWIGLEYKPKINTAQGLSWIEKYGFHL